MNHTHTDLQSRRSFLKGSAATAFTVAIDLEWGAEAQAAQPVFTGSSARPTGSGVTAWLTIGDMP